MRSSARRLGGNTRVCSVADHSGRGREPSDGARGRRKCPGVLDVAEFRTSGPLGNSRPPCCEMGSTTGGTMQSTSSLECSGTVGVHRDEAVTCTDDTCPTELPMAMWFSLHSTFVRCSTALHTDDCPNCGFETPVDVRQVERNLTTIATGRSRSRGRLLESARSRHPSSSHSE